MNKLIAELNGRVGELKGRVESSEKIDSVISLFDVDGLRDLLDIYLHYPLAGVNVDLDEENDNSGYSVVAKIMPFDEVVDEASRFQPGIVVRELSFMPFATCMRGSGDPYFLDLRAGVIDPPVVRICHELAVYAVFPVEKIEVIKPSLSDFFMVAEMS